MLMPTDRDELALPAKLKPRITSMTSEERWQWFDRLLDFVDEERGFLKRLDNPTPMDAVYEKATEYAYAYITREDRRWRDEQSAIENELWRQQRARQAQAQHFQQGGTEQPTLFQEAL